jgi:sortase (surface protein transpeptidase)
LGIDAAVLPVGIDKDGYMDVTKTASTVGWYRLGPVPGQPGNAVMTCHNQWYDTSRALCYDLHTVPVGADVYTSTGQGVGRRWKVVAVQAVAYNATVPGLFTDVGEPRLSIITCGGRWDPARQMFSLRIIVRARLAANATRNLT